MNSRSRNNVTGFAAGIMLVLLVVWITDAKATDRGGPEQEQSQDQEQLQGQSQSSEQENNQSISNSTETKVYAAGASSGSSTSTCSQVRDFRVADGFLFGLRFDMTDEDCRRLDLADKAYARGDTYFADTLVCTTPFVMATFESSSDCKDQLERNDVVPAMKERIDILERQKAALEAERAADQKACEESKDRIAEGCGK